MFDYVYIALAILFVFIGYRVVRSNPEMLKGEAMLEASKTLLFLATGLIAMIVFAIYFLRSI